MMMSVLWCVHRVDERDAVQKKTFTKWINKHLVKVACQPLHLYTAKLLLLLACDSDTRGGNDADDVVLSVITLCD